MILLIDNYDSFAYNLQRYLQRLGEQVVVVRNDAPQLLHAVESNDLDRFQGLWDTWRGCSTATTPRAIVISPGPKRPSDAGCCLELVRQVSGVLPILGVCLGHQIICEAFGGEVVRALQPIHGRSTPIELHPSRLFEGLSANAENGDAVKGVSAKATVEFARYHSLVAEPTSLPECLRVIAWSQDGQIMAVEHRQHATYGIQFHPESILSPAGYRVLGNFLKIVGCDVTEPLPASDLLDEQQLIPCPQSTGDLCDVEHAVVHPTSF